jgi:hypothetical protein
MRMLVPLALSTVLLGCPVGHQSPPMRAQEAASECAVNARFGRMEMAVAHVSPKAREPFSERRRAWGNIIRIADYELAGLQMHGDADADMYVKIAWYRVNESDLHVTTVKQKWHDFKGDWKLVEEARSTGDEGLLGEPVAASPGPTTPRNAQFPTIRIGSPETTAP